MACLLSPQVWGWSLGKCQLPKGQRYSLLWLASSEPVSYTLGEGDSGERMKGRGRERRMRWREKDEETRDGDEKEEVGIGKGVGMVWESLQGLEPQDANEAGSIVRACSPDCSPDCQT